MNKRFPLPLIYTNNDLVRNELNVEPIYLEEILADEIRSLVEPPVRPYVASHFPNASIWMFFMSVLGTFTALYSKSVSVFFLAVVTFVIGLFLHFYTKNLNRKIDSENAERKYLFERKTEAWKLCEFNFEDGKIYHPSGLTSELYNLHDLLTAVTADF